MNIFRQRLQFDIAYLVISSSTKEDLFSVIDVTFLFRDNPSQAGKRQEDVSKGKDAASGQGSNAGKSTQERGKPAQTMCVIHF